MNEELEATDCLDCEYFEQSPVDFDGYGHCNKRNCFVKTQRISFDTENCKTFRQKEESDKDTR